MRIIGKSILEIFCKKHTECSFRESFQEWHDKIKDSYWDKPSDVLNTFNNADPSLKTKNKNIVCVFNTICGSRLICRIDYDIKVVCIYEALTHDEYMEKKWMDKH